MQLGTSISLNFKEERMGSFILEALNALTAWLNAIHSERQWRYYGNPENDDAHLTFEIETQKMKKNRYQFAIEASTTGRPGSNIFIIFFEAIDPGCSYKKIEIYIALASDLYPLSKRDDSWGEAETVGKQALEQLAAYLKLIPRKTFKK